MRLDGDDYLDENALQVMTNYLSDNPGIGHFLTGLLIIDEKI